jgi:hypothetical protein
MEFGQLGLLVVWSVWESLPCVGWMHWKRFGKSRTAEVIKGPTV